MPTGRIPTCASDRGAQRFDHFFVKNAEASYVDTFPQDPQRLLSHVRDVNDTHFWSDHAAVFINVSF